jgi:hypothetical protein
MAEHYFGELGVDEGNIKMNVKETGFGDGDWIHLGQDMTL